MTFNLHQPQRPLTFATTANAASCGMVSGGMFMTKLGTIALRNPLQPGSWCRRNSRDQRS